MSDSVKTAARRISKRPKAKKSGEHPAVVAYRKKIESITDGTLPQLEDLNRRINALGRSTPPADGRDPRREEEDDEFIPIDLVDVEVVEEKVPRLPSGSEKKRT